MIPYTALLGVIGPIGDLLPLLEPSLDGICERDVLVAGKSRLFLWAAGEEAHLDRRPEDPRDIQVASWFDCDVLHSLLALLYLGVVVIRVGVSPYDLYCGRLDLGVGVQGLRRVLELN